MKFQFFLILCCLPLSIFSQETLSMENVESRSELSMSEVNGRTSQGVYRYFVKGATEPFTGVLYATYPSGEILTRQEFVDGIGQGKWINYYENGNYKEIGHYEQNRVEGPIQKFHPNGQLKAKGTYKNWRVKIDEWQYFDEKGKRTKTVDYGQKGSLEEVEDYFNRGEISSTWYKQILSDNGF